MNSSKTRPRDEYGVLYQCESHLRVPRLLPVFRGMKSLVLALAATALAHQPSSRKSLGFGPKNPLVKFVTNPARVPSFVPLTTPRDVAVNFLTSIQAARPGSPNVEGLDYVIRDDSYTDERTGVSHIYVRQLWNGVEVADGNINLNIMDGEVISYSDSFFRGKTSEDFYNREPAEDFHGVFCAHNSGSVEEPNWNEQLVIGHDTLSSKSGHVNCNTISTIDKARLMSLAKSDLSQEGSNEPQKALLHFMIAAHPSPEYAESLLNNFDELVKKMDLVFTSHLVGASHYPTVEVRNVPGAVNPVKAKLVYVQSPNLEDTQLTLTWKFEIEMQDNWYEAYIDVSHPSHIHTVVDWTSDAPIPEPKPSLVPKYTVWRWGINDPSEGVPSVESGYDRLASPLGWHTLPLANDPSESALGHDPGQLRNTTTTWGNNVRLPLVNAPQSEPFVSQVFAHENWEGANNWIENYRPDAQDLNFDYKYGTKKNEPASDPKDYVNLTVTQLFYTANKVHDLFYRYGFDEVSGNFQQYNFGKGGKEGDGVIANAQDGSGYNNANFATPPDGQHGRCRMYIWNTAVVGIVFFLSPENSVTEKVLISQPYRDGDLESGIVIHELAHGLSTRLTGGPANSGCLGWGESGGMGEGWGDFIATTVRSTSAYKDYPMGAWAANQERGIRNYPYSTDMSINPSTYKTLDKPGYWGVHAIGEVWAEILWVIEQEFIKKHGFSDTLFPPQPDENGDIPEGDFYHKQEYRADGTKKPLVPKHGNSLFLQLVINAMKLQPCRPSFFDTRDSILQADRILTGGKNQCELWIGFSQRGLGPDATIIGSTPWGGGVRTDDFDVPPGVCNK
ncbi:Fungalysin metallopeptidase-domain-containing protein [Cantharellus anzutake]|uniref:Fungalysin metallopeptidase-domain-containing protein n=1 Tax=Cantharellus anzutake TaxID=1750568 RepID=UPI001904AD44|nr:Fungalysin metallopeptidase-domain-containing protein [Cantharellus anzutake]KAF8315785.1 Fungalysin metallopeptidase-domain-containing protein [Cantharellus anzutake]